ncbi:hypothetical protein Corgl_0591 [Coriobacterium glomerans PW2]|uniref:Uncharacterized protein n=1 Tax=Coriobacterium glomerans (strain ATCC 49209 / DSM 20642 / JCM 10262 / PW2) TaxID=700015 RepID=F2NBG9_CORGP|nr:hypothetical protein Corgl_0591 [Coriobacterium glomerans PW2]
MIRSSDELACVDSILKHAGTGVAAVDMDDGEDSQRYNKILLAPALGAVQRVDLAFVYLDRAKLRAHQQRKMTSWLWGS